MKTLFVALFFIANCFYMNSCKKKEKVDLIVSNAVVYVVDENFSIAESFAVNKGKIAAFGTNKEIQNQFTGTKTIDANQKFVYPGFNDAHCHFNGYGNNLIQYADLRETKSPDEIYGILQNHHNTFGGEWVLGRSWDQNDWGKKEFPDREKLDVLFPDTPVYLVRIDGHAAWCNAKALELAGINKTTKVDGGTVLLKNGETSGVLIDNAMDLVGRLIPEITTEKKEKGLIEAQKNCFSVGITSLTDAGLEKSSVLMIEEMQKAGVLKIRVNAMLSPSAENIEAFISKGPKKSERLVVRTIKLFADGALGSRGALLLNDYSDDPGNKGLKLQTQEDYDKICRLAYNNNYIVATHAIGDGGNRLVLDTYAKFLKGKNDRRWRIEHAQIVHPDDFQKFADFCVIPSIQTTHCTSDMYWVKDRLGEVRTKGAYAYQTLLKQNGWLPNGTDFPVENIEPMFTYYAAVFRTDHEGWPEGGWHIEEGLTRKQALRSMTLWSAKASFEENEKGSLEPGKYADFVIMDTDLMKATPQGVLNAKVESTWIAGEKVFDINNN